MLDTTKICDKFFHMKFIGLHFFSTKMLLNWHDIYLRFSPVIFFVLTAQLPYFHTTSHSFRLSRLQNRIPIMTYAPSLSGYLLTWMTLGCGGGVGPDTEGKTRAMSLWRPRTDGSLHWRKWIQMDWSSSSLHKPTKSPSWPSTRMKSSSGSPEKWSPPLREDIIKIKI